MASRPDANVGLAATFAAMLNWGIRCETHQWDYNETRTQRGFTGIQNLYAAILLDSVNVYTGSAAINGNAFYLDKSQRRIKRAELEREWLMSDTEECDDGVTFLECCYALRIDPSAFRRELAKLPFGAAQPTRKPYGSRGW